VPEVFLNEPLNLLSRADASRKIATGKLKVETKSIFGQFMTPASVASFMATLFPATSRRNIKLLDPGAGVGSLTSAFIDHWCQNRATGQIEVDTYEIDQVMRPYLENNLELCKTTAAGNGSPLAWRIFKEDFIIEAARKIASLNGLWAENTRQYTHCIMNPPYKKISSSSHHRISLRAAGIETVNLYSAFVALSLPLLEDGGYLVAIIPRSFCNGPYYRPFREFILKHSAVRRLHLFGSRNKAFKDDKVLQENIIVVCEKGGRPGDVAISTSTDDSFSDISLAQYPFRQIVRAGDRELVIHIPTSATADFLDGSAAVSSTVADLGVQVSTGPVVDFRMKEHLRDMPASGTVPLLYPCHFKGQSSQWPIEGGKKPNAIVSNQDTRKWLYPNGFYTVVRRFSSKEEKRRIVASVVDPTVFGEAEYLGLENHLNLFHGNKKPLPEALARGLAVFLNSTAVDDNFRRYSGHTQVNATDLKRMKYPKRQALMELGEWAMTHGTVTQDMIDEEIARITA
jgi:adenine-specific DNA-methyltransferase